VLKFSWLLFVCTLSWGNYNYQELKVKDYEQMRKIINSYILKTQGIASDQTQKRSQSDIDPDEILLELKQALKVVFMRPDTDGLRNSLVLILEPEINIYKPFIEVLGDVVKEEAIPIFKNKKSSVISQAGALYILENAISYSKGYQKPEADKVFKVIKKAKIKIKDALIQHLRLEEGRGQTASPSHVAGQSLKQSLKARVLDQKKAQAILKKTKKKTSIPKNQKLKK